MLLEGQDSASHSILRLSDDAHTSSQAFTLSSTLDILVIVGGEVNDVVEIVPADMRLARRVVLVARRTAEVHRATNDELSSIVAHLSNEIFWRH